MKNIERFVSAYIFFCMFGGEQTPELEYTFYVLRTSGSGSKHPILQQVLDFVRQSDPASPDTQKVVRDYVIGFTQGVPTDIAKKPQAMYSIRHGMAIFTLWDADYKLLGMAVSTVGEIPQTKQILRDKFGDMEITEIPA